MSEPSKVNSSSAFFPFWRCQSNWPCYTETNGFTFFTPKSGGENKGTYFFAPAFIFFSWLDNIWNYWILWPWIRGQWVYFARIYWNFSVWVAVSNANFIALQNLESRLNSKQVSRYPNKLGSRKKCLFQKFNVLELSTCDMRHMNHMNLSHLS